MKMYIPSLGDEIVLLAPWSFDLYNEYRNSTLFEYLGLPYDNAWRSSAPPVSVTIPTGAQLKVDRIYIRKGQEDFDSITFLWKGAKTQAKLEPRYATPFIPNHPNYGQRTYVGDRKIPGRPVRFWTRLTDVNGMEFEPIKVGRPAAA